MNELIRSEDRAEERQRRGRLTKSEVIAKAQEAFPDLSGWEYELLRLVLVQARVVRRTNGTLRIRFDREKAPAVYRVIEEYLGSAIAVN